jgi:hypothetical protein
VRACWQSKTERDCVNWRVEVHNGYKLKAVDDYCVTWCISVHPLRSGRGGSCAVKRSGERGDYHVCECVW